MPREKPPDEREMFVGRQEEFYATVEEIGRRLQFQLAKILGEPLPDEIHNLLNELKQKQHRT